MSSIFFKDSFKFINLPLCLLPKSFGFHNELQKGFFPHLLNTKSNMSYVNDGLPNMEEFGVDEMGEGEMSRFLKWYERENQRLVGEKYDLRKEMKRYHYDDCYVLANAYGQFNESMINELVKSNVKDIVPHQYTTLADFITLSQLVTHWYIGTSMLSRSLAIVPNGGYDNGKCGSLKENIWLTYLDKLHEKEDGVNLYQLDLDIAMVKVKNRLVAITLKALEF